MEIKIGEKKYIIRELTADEMQDILADGKRTNKEVNYEIVAKSIGIPKEEIGKLSAKEYFVLLRKCNELNGLSGDFQ